MKEILQEISLGRLARYGYAGFLILLILKNSDAPIIGELPKDNTTILLLFVFTIGTTSYIFYRYFLGELILCRITDCVHCLYCRFWNLPNTNPAFFLRGIIHSRRVAGCNYNRSRDAYNYVRSSFFDKEFEKNLYFFHSEIYFLYATSIIALFYALFYRLFSPVEYEQSHYWFWWLMFAWVLLYFVAIVADIKQHERECRYLQNPNRQADLILFLDSYRLFE